MTVDDLHLGYGSQGACDIHISQQFRQQFAVQLMSGGSFYFQRGERPRAEINLPCFFWTDLRCHYQYGPGPTGTWQHNYLTYSGKLAKTHLLPLLEELAPEGYCPVSNFREIEEAFRRLIASLHQPSPSPHHQLHLFQHLLYLVEMGRPQAEPNTDPALQRVQHLFDTAPEQAYDFPRLAREHGFSYSNFRRRFREAFGRAPHQYLTQRRLQVAAHRLANTSETVQEIGDALGYPEPPRFSKAFKQQYGLPPRDYRNIALLRAPR